MARRPDPRNGGSAARDAELWARVTADVRPLGGKPATPALPRIRVDVRPQPIEAPAISRGRALAPPEAASLDGGWDRRIRKGELEPATTVDLHGMTQVEAYAALEEAIPRAFRHGARTVLVITGKARPLDPDDERPRGIIAANFTRWLATPALRPFIAAVRPAHRRHGGGGAWYVVLRRKR